MIDAVRLTFAALRESRRPQAGDLAVRVLPGAPPGVYLGLDLEARPHLLVETADETTGSTGMAAVSVGQRTLVITGGPQRFVDVTCEDAALTEVFDHFVVAVVERLAERPPVPAILEVVESWRRFLVSAAGPPGRDRLAALFGELLVVLDLVKADPLRRIDVWVGPFGARHDLRRGKAAIEVKTTRSHTARVVTIHGEDQLLEPEDGSLHLHLVRIEEVPEGGVSVPALIDAILSTGAPAGDVFDAVAASGVAPADFPSAANVAFDIRERLTVPVDDRTPRIVPSSFASGARPVGVVDLVYRVDLDHVLDRVLDDAAYAELLARIASTEPA